MYLHSKREERSLKVQLPQTARMLWKASLTKISAYHEAHRTRIAPAKCVPAAVQDNSSAHSRFPPADHYQRDHEIASLATTPSLTLSDSYSSGDVNSIHSLTSSLSSSLSLAHDNLAAPGKPNKSVTTMQIREWLRKPLRKLHRGMIHVNAAFLLRTSVSSPAMSSPTPVPHTYLPEPTSIPEADTAASTGAYTSTSDVEDSADSDEESMATGRSAFDATHYSPANKYKYVLSISMRLYLRLPSAMRQKRVRLTTDRCSTARVRYIHSKRLWRCAD